MPRNFGRNPTTGAEGVRPEASVEADSSDTGVGVKLKFEAIAKKPVSNSTDGPTRDKPSTPGKGNPFFIKALMRSLISGAKDLNNDWSACKCQHQLGSKAQTCKHTWIGARLMGPSVEDTTFIVKSSSVILSTMTGVVFNIFA